MSHQTELLNFVQAGGLFATLRDLHHIDVLAITSVPTYEGQNEETKLDQFGLGGNGATELSHVWERALSAYVINTGEIFRSHQATTEADLGTNIQDLQAKIGKRVDESVQQKVREIASKHAQPVIVESKLFEVLAQFAKNKLELALRAIQMFPIALETNPNIATARLSDRRRMQGQPDEMEVVKQSRIEYFGNTAKSYKDMYGLNYSPDLIRKNAAIVIDNSFLTPAETSEAAGYALLTYARKIPHAFIDLLLNT